VAATKNALERGSACSGHIKLEQSTFLLEVYVEHPNPRNKHKIIVSQIISFIASFLYIENDRKAM
jgi:hypothetical protein